MKRIFLLTSFVIISCLPSLAQKFGYIDTEFILKKVPEYAEAQKEIDKLGVEYQQQMEKMKIKKRWK